MNLSKEQLNERIENLGGELNGNIAEFSFSENVSNDGESITLKAAIFVEKQMMDLGFDGALLGSSLDESDWSVIRFEI